jgi:hypothetical protein
MGKSVFVGFEDFGMFFVYICVFKGSVTWDFQGPGFFMNREQVKINLFCKMGKLVLVGFEDFSMFFLYMCV